MSELAQKAADLGIEIKEGWSDQYIKRQITMSEHNKGGDKPVSQDKILVELLANYRPVGDYEVVKSVDGPYPGVGTPGKLWSGTEVRLEKSEAAALIQNEIKVRETYKDPETGRNQTRTVVQRRPLARMDIDFDS